MKRLSLFNKLFLILCLVFIIVIILKVPVEHDNDSQEVNTTASTAIEHE